MSESLQLRIYGPPTLPTLIYLPGLHGDGTLVGAFRSALAQRVRFVEITYPRTLTWSLLDYARAVEAALLEHGITRGWLFGESFSSQVAWAMAGATLEGNRDEIEGIIPARSARLGPREPLARSRFQIQGLILAGGFVRHPAPWGVWGLRVCNRLLPLVCLRGCLALFGSYARVRFRHAPESLAGIGEFVQNRGEKLDRAALRHRLRLIAENDLQPIARRTTLPVYSLTGLIDGIVPWPWVSHWLKRNCPGYRATKVLWGGKHNFCLSAPAAAAEQVVEWIGPSVGFVHAPMSKAARPSAR
jgi:pimeloyl-ACP methyl ester carboxylesterase